MMKQFRRQGRGVSGFSLIELMVALFVITLAVSASLEAIIVANTLSIEAKEMTIAMNDARAVLERVKITALAALPTDTTVNASTIWATLSTFVANSLSNEQIQVTGGTGTTLRQITVTVTWTGPRNKTKTVALTTQKSFFNG